MPSRRTRSPRQRQKTKRGIKGGADVSKCFDSTDPISLEDLANVSEQDLVAVPHETIPNKFWCFERQSLEGLLRTGDKRNPSTRLLWIFAQGRVMAQNFPMLKKSFSKTVIFRPEISIVYQVIQELPENLVPVARRKFKESVETCLTPFFQGYSFGISKPMKDTKLEQLEDLVQFVFDEKILGIDYVRTSNDSQIESDNDDFFEYKFHLEIKVDLYGKKVGEVVYETWSAEDEAQLENEIVTRLVTMFTVTVPHMVTVPNPSGQDSKMRSYGIRFEL